jgi:deazaflavin-dependent oxidoreductase (nitroreductase family)
MPERPSEYFLKPGRFVQLMNKTVGLLAYLGIGPAYIQLLRVRGRKSGKIYTTPVNLLEYGGLLFLVGGRGHTAWSKNVAACGTVELVRGLQVRRYRAIAVLDPEKPNILKAYLDEYSKTVQRFFAVPAGSPPDAFIPIADRHPAFELIPLD